MWLEYGPGWQVVGIDSGEITPCPEPSRQPELTRALTSSRFTYFQCAVHEARPANLLRPESVDILIDDASHEPEQVWAAFLNFWPVLKLGGYYIVEDVWSSRYLDLWHGRLQATYGMDAPRRFGWEVVANFKNDHGEYRDDDVMLILRKP
jgi:cephalosporin hydroxylase